MPEMDWREMRAKLIAQTQTSDEPSTSDPASPSSSTSSSTSSSSYVYETPLIEQGTILLGGTKMDFGFALRQQFFHKSVMLLLQHDENFTKGIILNRPSAHTVDGWRVWCGHGQVAEGGLFVGAEHKMGDLEMNCLHSLESPEAAEVSTTVIRGVSVTSLDHAKELVKSKVAKKSDFWVMVGYSGWAPGQLQMEVNQRDSWYLASADSGVLLTELLREARELPPATGVTAKDLLGIDTWENLMRGIGREDAIEKGQRSLADKMLEEWVRVHLLPWPILSPPAVPPQEVTLGTVLATTVSPTTNLPSDRILLQDQFLHKALLLVVDATPTTLVVCILNRPTEGKFQLTLPKSGKPLQRRVPFCGNIPVQDLWLHHRTIDLGGVVLGTSRIGILSTDQVTDRLGTDDAKLSDFLLVRGVVQFDREELGAMVSRGEMMPLTPGEQLSKLWPRVWALTDDKPPNVSDGTEIWWLATQCVGDDGTETLSAPATSDLADDALREWLTFFARHQSKDENTSK